MRHRDFQQGSAASTLLKNIRESVFRLSMVGLHRRVPKSRIDVFVVPTDTVKRSGILYIFELLNNCQGDIRFTVTPVLDIQRFTAIQYAKIEYIATIPRRTANIEIGNYISQKDFFPQLETFLVDGYGGHGPSSVATTDPMYVPNETLAILIGREKFVWDELDYTVTGDFNEDGYTVLYNNDTSNDPDRISPFNNLAVISMAKLIALPEIDFEVSRRGSYEELYVNAKTYIVSNIVHFLADRLFARSISSEHAAACILRLALTGGLFESLASRRFCAGCRRKMYRVGPAHRAWRSFPVDEMICNLEAMMNSLDRIDTVKRAGDALRLSAWGCLTLFGVSLLSNVLVNFTNDITFGQLVRRYMHPLELAAACVVLGGILFLGFGLCKWILPKEGAEI